MSNTPTNSAIKANNKQETLVSRFINNFTEWSLNWVPESMVFVFVLTIAIFFLAWGLTSHGPLQLVDDYAKGFWKLITFAMQMALLLITGFAVADSKYIKRGINFIVDIPQTRTSTILMYVLVSGAMWWMHWGIGTMGAIIMGRRIAVRKQHLQFHYPYLAAIAFVVVQLANGPSQAAQLLVATPGHFMEKVTGVIPLTETTFNPHLLACIAILFVTIPLMLLLVMPKPEHSTFISQELIKEFSAMDEEGEHEDVSKLRPAERWERSWYLQRLVACGGLVWIGQYLYANGFGKLNLDNLNFILFILAMFLHGTPHSLIRSVKQAVPVTYGIIVQFPLYAGIFGIISASGLSEIIAHWFVSISTHQTYPWIIFIYTGVLDFFVPSAGSKFVIEAPYIIPAGQALGISPNYIVNAYTAGSLWVNLIQPFWALPTLAAFRVRFQDILPFTFFTWVLSGIVYSIMFLLFPTGF